MLSSGRAHSCACRQRHPSLHQFFPSALEGLGYDLRTSHVSHFSASSCPPMPKPPSLSYTVSCLHPDTRNFHGESCTTLEEAEQRVKDLRAAGYQSVTISPPDRNTPSWPKN